MHAKRLFSRKAGFLVLVLIAAICLAGCAGEEKQAELEVSDSEFTIKKSVNDYVINAKGTVANKSDVDVSNVEITGYCTSCGEEIVEGQWFVSDYEKMDHQKDVITSLPAGASRDFEFEEVAFFSSPRTDERPEELPGGLEVTIESYEISK